MTGGPAVSAARLYQNLCDGLGGDLGGDIGSGADGPADPGEDPARAVQPGQSLADQPLPARARLDDATTKDGADDRGFALRDHGLAAHAPWRRVHAEYGRRRSALYAFRIAGALGGGGVARSEERRVGKEWGGKCRSRGEREHKK